MPDGLNKVMLIGNLGVDPELRFTANGNALCTFRVAVNRSRNTPEGRKEETEWFRVVAWSKLAEFVQQYITKGQKVYIEGRLTTRSWDGPDGQKRYMTEVVAEQLISLDRPQGTPFPDSGGELDPDDLPFE